jgi:hypothetical protein
MRSVKLAKALARGKVFVRNPKTGQVLLKFRTPGVADRILQPYSVEDEHRKETFINLCVYYTPEQLKASNLEDNLIQGDLELMDPELAK